MVRILPHFCLGVAALAAPRALTGAANFELPAGGATACPCTSETELGSQAALNYPAGYGLNCRAHDVGLPRCQGKVKPNWCNQSWCFVQPDECDLPMQELVPGSGAYVSYATCGYLSAWKSSLLTTNLHGVSLKVVLLTNTGGWMGSYCNAAEGTCAGPTYAFWMKVLQAAGATVNISYIFNASWAGPGDLPFPPQVMAQFRRDLPTTSSIFTACVYAAGMGYVDLCIGEATISPQRLLLSTLVETHYNYQVLVILAGDTPDQTLWQSVFNIFSVFSPNVWVAIIFCTATMSLLIAWHEGSGVSGEEGEFKHLHWTAIIEMSLYCGFKSLVGGDAFSPSNRGARVVNLGLSLFVLLTVSTYTANLASALVVQNTPPPTVQSLGDAVRQNALICVLDNDASLIISNTGVDARLLVRTFAKADTVQGLFDGRCTAAIMEQEVLERAQGDGVCGLLKVGDPLLAIPQGAPTSERVFRTLELYVNTLRTSGVWTSETEAAKPWDICGGAAPTSSSTQAMQLADFYGPIALAAAACIMSVVIQASCFLQDVTVRNWKARRRRRDGQPEEDEPGCDLGNVVVEPANQHHKLADDNGEGTEAQDSFAVTPPSEVDASANDVKDALQEMRQESARLRALSEKMSQDMERHGRVEETLRHVLELLQHGDAGRHAGSASRSAAPTSSLSMVGPRLQAFGDLPAPTLLEFCAQDASPTEPPNSMPQEDSGGHFPQYVPKLRGRVGALQRLRPQSPRM